MSFEKVAVLDPPLHQGGGRVAIVIVNWNGWRDTVECLESVLSCSATTDSIVVCDNASRDDSIDQLRSWWAARSDGGRHAERSFTVIAAEEAGGQGSLDTAGITVIRSQANRGFAGGNNVAIQYAVRDPEVRYIWLLNNDTIVDEDTLDQLVGYAEAHPKVGISGSKILFHAEPKRIQAAGGGRLIRWQGLTAFARAGELDGHGPERGAPLEYVTGCSMLVRREVIDDIGYLAEEYFLYSEEVDWCLRARAAGWHLGYCPTSQVWHKDGRSTKPKSPLADYYSVRSSLLLTKKFAPRLMSIVLVSSFFRCLLPKALRLRWDRVSAVLRAYRDFFGGRGRGRESRSPPPALSHSRPTELEVGA